MSLVIIISLCFDEDNGSYEQSYDDDQHKAPHNEEYLVQDDAA